jgi:Trypsin
MRSVQATQKLGFMVRSSSAALLAGLFLLGCGSDPGDGTAAKEPEGTEPQVKEVSSVSEPILNGLVADSDTNARGGFVALAFFDSSNKEHVFCSGTLYANAFLMTARHCFNASTTTFLQSNPSKLKVTMGRNSSSLVTRSGKAIYFPASTVDYAIVELSSGFSMPRNSDNMMSTTGYSRSFTTVADKTPVICTGYGRSSETCDSSGNNCTGSGVGTLRIAALTSELIQNTPVNFYRYEPNSQGQLQAHGDSGGGCVSLLLAPVAMWRQPLISVTSSCFPGDFCNAEMAAAALFDTWTKISP